MALIAYHSHRFWGLQPGIVGGEGAFFRILPSTVTQLDSVGMGKEYSTFSLGLMVDCSLNICCYISN